MFIVQKFGGSSLADAQKVKNVAKRIAAAYENGKNKVVVVLSAQGKTTDSLIAKAKEVNPNPSRREMDMLLSTGEQQAVALMAMALQAEGLRAVSLNAVQVGINTTSNYGNATIHSISTGRIRLELERDNIVLVTGFQGCSKFEDITTLGRGGSDTSAVALAAVLKADKCEIYTDVEGVYTADPRIVKDAQKLKEISYDEMLELASLGAKVLHTRSVEMAKKYNVNLVVRSSLCQTEGTIVKEECRVEKVLVSGVASDKDVSRISVLGVNDEPGKAFYLFSLLSRHHISVDIILQSIGRHNKKDISFTVSRGDLEEALKVIEEDRDIITAEEITHDDNIAKVSIVGAGMATNSGVASLMFEALYDAGVNIDMISTSEIKITVLVDEADADRAVLAIHEKFKKEGDAMRRD